MKALYWSVHRFNLCHMIRFVDLTYLIGRRHNHLFPNVCPLPSSAIPEIKDVLIYAIGGM